MMSRVSFLSQNYSLEDEHWRYSPEAIAEFFREHGAFEFPPNLLLSYLSNAPYMRCPQPSRSSFAVVPVLTSRPSGSTPCSVLGSSHAAPAPGLSSMELLVYLALLKCRGPPTSGVIPQPKKLKTGPKSQPVVVSSDNESKRLVTSPYKTCSRRAPPSSVEVPDIDLALASPRARPSKTSVKKVVEKVVDKTVSSSQLDVGSLWAKQGTSGDKFPREWVNRARKMDLQLEYGDTKLDFFQILEAARSTAFFDKFTPCQGCLLRGSDKCYQVWTPGKAASTYRYRG
ncbi:hypothetical protein E1B28_005940 [Marasmius oreades]|uniref:Uncharacterized protein n=1 Tax=Marasmius oreades TaxID=181124 RepID=A0A9P7UVY7_9AGAR|nr:uncharacterized protein E1B28_005940 [Marasmius oreades]KAG7095161.1 hypothetical protein E1B28_005940 [Marasmius oreades]